jgi:hypothetical protein
LHSPGFYPQNQKERESWGNKERKKKEKEGRKKGRKGGQPRMTNKRSIYEFSRFDFMFARQELYRLSHSTSSRFGFMKTYGTHLSYELCSLRLKSQRK